MTGLSPEQLAELTDRVREVVGPWERPPVGGPHALPLSTAVVAVLFGLRHNIADDVAAEVFGCSQATGSTVPCISNRSAPKEGHPSNFKSAPLRSPSLKETALSRPANRNSEIFWFPRFWTHAPYRFRTAALGLRSAFTFGVARQPQREDFHRRFVANPRAISHRVKPRLTVNLFKIVSETDHLFENRLPRRPGWRQKVIARGRIGIMRDDTCYHSCRHIHR
jgi:hypothetical protein